MGKAKYHFNEHTLNYDRIDNTIRHRLIKIGQYLIGSILMGIVFFVIFIFTVKSPNEKLLEAENKRISTQYELLSRQLDDAMEVLTNIQQRDDNFYRVVLQVDSIPSSIRRGNYINSNRYQKLLRMRTSDLVIATSQKMDMVSRMLYIQSNSFDELVALAKQEEKKLQHIPAIQPIPNKDLKRTASGYGWRIDPIYHTRRFHQGMDFSAPTGTKIFATGNGTVIKAGWEQGYGNAVFINHGFGYVTVYAHMHQLKKGLRRGSKVSRGEVIGFVGNTGKSTGPHLHYEVRLKGKPQNPQNYYFMDLSPEEYDQMIQISANYGRVFD
ncbi:MAG TPA: M23 family metallopeptidase [Paludibacteraceae bacterium]|nr:M23 family metallopeptidase [Paludibacteraceae bacterium]